MATLDWSQCPAVESIPGKVSGAWVFKDTRMPVSTVFENLESGRLSTRSWNGFKAAEKAGFEVLITTDKNIVTQRNLERRAISIVVLGNSQWRIVQRHVRKVAAAVSAATPGSYVEVEIPFD